MSNTPSLPKRQLSNPEAPGPLCKVARIGQTLNFTFESGASRSLEDMIAEGLIAPGLITPPFPTLWHQREAYYTRRGTFPFMKLPAELRLQIYDDLVVSPEEVLASRHVRKGKKYHLSLSIFRVSRQVYAEAHAVFLEKHTFFISAASSSTYPDISAQASECWSTGTDGRCLLADHEKTTASIQASINAAHNNGDIDPPIRRAHWPSLRHVKLELMYYPQASGHMGELRVENGCARYIQNLAELIKVAGPNLRSLAISVTIDEESCARKTLVPFFLCDRDSEFVRALVALDPAPVRKSFLGLGPVSTWPFAGSSSGSSSTTPFSSTAFNSTVSSTNTASSLTTPSTSSAPPTPHITSIPIHFDYPDSYYHISMAPSEFQRRSLLLQACQVMFCQSQAKIDRLISYGGDGAAWKANEGKERVDLKPVVEKANRDWRP